MDLRDDQSNRTGMSRQRSRDRSEDSETARKRQADFDMLNEAQKRDIAARLHALKLEGRLLPDSAMTTYFGKPAFHPYGNGNVKPTSGGLIYGGYLKSHNVNPHSGDNKPAEMQTFTKALTNPQAPLPPRQNKSPSNRKGNLKDTKESKEAVEAAATRYALESASLRVRKPCPPRQPKRERPLTAA